MHNASTALSVGPIAVSGTSVSIWYVPHTHTHRRPSEQLTTPSPIYAALRPEPAATCTDHSHTAAEAHKPHIRHSRSAGHRAISRWTPAFRILITRRASASGVSRSPPGTVAEAVQSGRARGARGSSLRTSEHLLSACRKPPHPGSSGPEPSRVRVRDRVYEEYARASGYIAYARLSSLHFALVPHCQLPTARRPSHAFVFRFDTRHLQRCPGKSAPSAAANNVPARGRASLARARNGILQTRRQEVTVSLADHHAYGALPSTARVPRQDEHHLARRGPPGSLQEVRVYVSIRAVATAQDTTADVEYAIRMLAKTGQEPGQWLSRTAMNYDAPGTWRGMLTRVRRSEAGTRIDQATATATAFWQSSSIEVAAACGVLDAYLFPPDAHESGHCQVGSRLAPGLGASDVSDSSGACAVVRATYASLGAGGL
ncbi:hypothetical protein C8T65DRAFT_745393 [Cerioporus squamosus]|nr:hypothetical protein C8T65DRAFT_745393 [Cerioporus squamosus]